MCDLLLLLFADVCCLLRVVFCLLFVVWCVMFIVGCVAFVVAVVCCLLPDAVDCCCCLLCRCSLFVVGRVSLDVLFAVVVCVLLVCYLLFADCCSSFGTECRLLFVV